MRFRGVVLICAVSGCLYQHVFAANGIAVSVSWRYGDNAQLIPEAGWYEQYWWRGQLVKCTIKGDSVFSTDTIHRFSNGLAQYPALNVEGSKAAFYRWGTAVTKSSTSNTYSLTNTTKKDSIAVINLSTNAVTNLCELTSHPGFDAALDWPAGDWIYYGMPVYDATAQDGGKTQSYYVERAIYKVNASTGENVLVSTPKPGTSSCSLRRFTLSNDAAYCAVELKNGVGGNYLFGFPPPNNNISSSPILGQLPGCNVGVSASGTYAGNFFAGYHQEIYVSKVNRHTGNGYNDFPTVAMPTLANVKSWDIHQRTPGCGAECIRWSCNSDKWVLEQSGLIAHASDMCYGTNQVLVNWIDRKAIVTSNNHKWFLSRCEGGDPMALASGSYLYTGNCTGDFWVEPPSGQNGKYEDSAGVWHAVSTQIENHQSSCISGAPARICVEKGVITIVSSSTHSAVSIFDMHGRILIARKGTRIVTIPARTLAHGTCIVSCVNGSEKWSKVIALD
jgi:hypothetical protein